MPELVEHADRLEVVSPMRGGLRLVFALLALFPLLAPYELLLRVNWQSYLHPFFLLAALISAGAVALSAFLLLAAVAGLSSRMVFDKAGQTFTHTAEAPLVRRVTAVYPLSAIARIDVKSREWSDSSPTYYLDVVITGGERFESGASPLRDEVEIIRGRLMAYLDNKGSARSGFDG